MSSNLKSCNSYFQIFIGGWNTNVCIKGKCVNLRHKGKKNLLKIL